MAVNYNPTIKLALSGTDITAYSLESSFVLDTKLEESHNINSVSSAVEIDISNISNIKMLMFHSTSAFKITLTKSVTSPLSETFDYDFVIPNNGGIPAIFSVDQAFITGLKRITITTTSTNLIKVNIRAYGEVVTV